MTALDPAKQRILVTGGTGFLGKHVVSNLESSSAKVLPVGSKDYDLTDQISVKQMFCDLSPTVVVHLAASCGGISANVENPGKFIHDNLIMGLLLLEESRLHRLNKFVLISTTCAYPKNAPLPLHEDSIWSGKPVGATGPYGIAKRSLHEACSAYHKQYGLNSSVLIPANLYGPGDHFDENRSHVVPALIRRIVKAHNDGQDEVVNWGTGKPTREFLHVTDAAEAIRRAVEKDTSATPINLGTGVETSIKSLTTVIAQVVGYQGRISWDTTKPDGQPRRFLDITRAKEILGFEPKIGLLEGIEQTVEWYMTRGCAN